MITSKAWLKQYIERDFTSKEIDQGLTQAGLEVDLVTDLSQAFSDKVVVGQVVACEKHPQADRLSLCQVSDGEQNYQVICGAKNCRTGLKTPFAKLGAKLVGGVTIEKASLKGLDSYGMLCSAKELGVEAGLLSERDKEGIWELDGRLPLGLPLAQALGFSDVTFDLSITPNRADCFGMIQIARELAMMHEEELKVPKVRNDQDQADIKDWIKVSIEDENLSNRYLARVLREVKIGPSPLWMQGLLRASGIRPINNVVDVTNYVMLETSQPLHAFDYDKISGKEISVRAARAGEEVVTLDGKARTLVEKDIVITDADKPVAVAGVMGAENSQVDEKTKTILFESAHFDYAHVRNTSRRLGLRSEASGRFERGLSPEGSLYAINRALDLLEEMGAGRAVAGALDVYPKKQKRYSIKVDTDRVNRTLGTDLSKATILTYFKRLGFSLEEGEDGSVEVLVPPYRMDISRHVDLIEEVARIYGYDNIPVTLPVSATNTLREKADISLSRRVKTILAGLGLSEIITYAFIDPKDIDRLGLDPEKTDRLKLLNPLSVDQSEMRTSLIPGMLKTAHNNMRKNQKELRLFEVGKVFLPKGKKEQPLEVRKLSCLVSGPEERAWHGKVPALDFFYAKGITDAFLSALMVDDVVYEPYADHPSFHPGRTARLLRKGQPIGILGEIHPRVEDSYQLSQRVYVLEMDLEALVDAQVSLASFQDLAKYPSTLRDIAFSVPEAVTHADIMAVINKASNDKVVDYRLFDLYQGQQIEEGRKSLAYSLTYQDKERTLKDKEVQSLHQAIRQSLEEDLGAKLRE